MLLFFSLCRNLCNVWKESLGHQELQADICVTENQPENICTFETVKDRFGDDYSC